MKSRINTRSRRMLALATCVITTWMGCRTAWAQDFIVAYQSRQAGESASDDPEDTGDRGAVDAVDDAAQAAAETLTPAEQAAALERRAGERVGGLPRGRANVLGMSLQEGERGRVQVVDVAAASPAFDAGVQKGDVIVSFAGFQGESYRDWIEGMGRLVTDTPDGETIAVDLIRGGKRVAAIIRAPEARADDPRLPGLRPLQQDRQSAQGQIGLAPIPLPNQPLINGSGSDVFINNAPFSEAFNAGDANVNDRAMAEIIRLNPQQQTAVGNRPNAEIGAQRRDTPTPTAEPQPAIESSANTRATGRIGVAGFRNDVEGLLVMIDIAGLEPGSYRVGIDDPGIVMGSGQDAAIETSPGAIGDRAPAQTSPSGNQSGGAIPQPDAARTSLADPAATPADGRTDQSNIPSTGQVRPLSTPPSGQVRPLSAPPSGQARPLTSTPAGLPDTRHPGRADTLPRGTAQTGTLSQIGILTVDQSGTGRFQQVVEGVQVAEIVGQAIVIYAPAKPPQTAVPPDPNVSGVREGAGDPNVPVQRQTTAASGNVPVQPVPQAAGVAQVNGHTQPIAAGVIRLLSDRRPTVTELESPPGNLDTNPQAQEPATEADRIERAARPQPQTR